MAIELSNLTFTEQDDIVPSSGVEQILNTGIANTFAGNDIIIGTSTSSDFNTVGINNYSGVINTGEGDDILIATTTGVFGYGIQNYTHNIYTDDGGIIKTGAGKDTIIAIGPTYGIYNFKTIDTGTDNDIITATGGENGILNAGIIDTNDGRDIITGIATSGVNYGGISNNDDSIIDTGNDNDIITGIGVIGINNYGIINIGNGEDSIISQGKFFNRGGVFSGDGNDSIIADTDFPNRALENFNFIGTGEGNDTITSPGFIYNQGVIETGNGDDSIIVDGGIDDITGTTYGIYNNGGAINTGDGNDSIISNAGFESAENSSGAWFLGEGEDYIKGFGSGDFYGGNGNDTLELTPGTYTVGRWGEGGESPIFTKGDQLMITSEFEKLKAGSTIYDFTSLTAGQIIVVA
jgi:hypothetical protein